MQLLLLLFLLLLLQVQLIMDFFNKGGSEGSMYIYSSCNCKSRWYDFHKCKQSSNVVAAFIMIVVVAVVDCEFLQ